MTKDELIKELNKISREKNRDYETTHLKADSLLIEYIKDNEIAQAYHGVGKWYS